MPRKYNLGDSVTDVEHLLRLLKEDGRVHVKRLDRVRHVKHLVNMPFLSVMALLGAEDLREATLVKPKREEDDTTNTLSN